MSVGYSLDRFVDLSESDENNLMCGICHEVLRSPVVTPCCGQMFCNTCIVEWLKNSATCPWDRQTLTPLKLSKPPRMVINQLGELKIKCDFEKRGCPHVVPLEKLSQHLEVCLFRDVCDKCSNKSQPFIEQLIQTNDNFKEEINRLKSTIEGLENEKKKEMDNYLQTIQELQNQLDVVDPLLGPSDKRVFKAWKQITFGLEINEFQIILNVRKYLSENEPIVTTSEKMKEISESIVDFVTKQLFEEKSVFNICKNVVTKLDLDYGNNWQCLADYEDSSMAYFTYEKGFYLKLRYDLLQFKIFKSFNCDEQNFIDRFRAITIKHDIEIKRNGMADKMVSFIKRITFAAIEKYDTIYDILSEIESRLGREYGGQWYCMAYSFGAFPIRKIRGSFIEFQLLDFRFIIYQTNH